MGLAGDIQADRCHGGVDKAICHFPQQHYAGIRARFPDALATHIGENFATETLDETSVHIGDVFGIGTATIEVSEPRIPCWKINAVLECQGVLGFFLEQGICGWYYRIIKTGTVQKGQMLQRIRSNPSNPTVQQALWQIASK